MRNLGNQDAPRELDKLTIAAYIVEPPDILNIESVSTLRTPDSLLVPGDRLRIMLRNGLPIDIGSDQKENQLQYDAESQIEVAFKVLSGTYRIDSDGALNFGPSYGKVAVANLTLAEAETVIRKHLTTKVGLKSPEMLVTLEDVEAPQPIRGEHLVRPDGCVSLGIYGDVFVTGKTLPEVALSIKNHLAENGIQDPRVAVDVVAYNSKQYYVITDGGGFGEAVARVPFTGNETVLDAISQIQGLPEISSKEIWIARPNPDGEPQILNVAWSDIAARGKTETNFQILPGDRIYIKADHMIALDNTVEKLVAPFERILGVMTLGGNALRYTLGIYPIKSTGGSSGFS